MKHIFEFRNVVLIFFLSFSTVIAEAAPYCEKFFSALTDDGKMAFERNLYALVERLNSNTNASEREQLFKELQLELEKHGIRAQPVDSTLQALRILPDGDAKISRVIRGLNRYGIDIRLEPKALKDAYGAYSKIENVLKIDLESLANDQLTPVMAHEVRHAVDALRSGESGGNFERLFQAALMAPVLTKIIPGMKAEGYSARFRLDEILAHRQSAKNLVKVIFSRQKQGKNFDTELKQLRGHVGRFQRFVDGWRGSAPILEKEILAGSFSYLVHGVKNGDGYQTLLIRVEPSSFFQGIFRKIKQNPEHVGLGLELPISSQEANAILNKKDVSRIVLPKIAEISSGIGKIQAAVEELEKSLSSMDVKNLSAVDQKITELSRVLGELK